MKLLLLISITVLIGLVAYDETPEQIVITITIVEDEVPKEKVTVKYDTPAAALLVPNPQVVISQQMAVSKSHLTTTQVT